MVKTVELDTSYFDETIFGLFDQRLAQFEQECGVTRVEVRVGPSKFGDKVLARTPVYKNKGKIQTLSKLIRAYYPIFLKQHPKFNFSRSWK